MTSKNEFFNSLDWITPKTPIPLDKFLEVHIDGGIAYIDREKEYHLVGDVNLNGGVCSCCGRGGYVVSYAYLWERNR